jgi:hypothetical protein
MHRVRWQAQLVLRSYEKAFFARKYDVIGDSEWGRFERQLCVHDARAQSAGIDPYPILASEFVDYIRNECRD